MNNKPLHHTPPNFTGWTRREFLRASVAGGLVAASGLSLYSWANQPTLYAETFIAGVSGYSSEIRAAILHGMKELGILASDIKGKRILLKPNLVETHLGSTHINTHPMVVRGAVEAFLSLGAHQVLVGEGPGHRRDTLDVLQTSGLADVLYEDHIRFLDLNYEEGVSIKNIGFQSAMHTLTFPKAFQSIDWIVSLAKLKTHHWAGATLSMKNLFGVMPGIYYGWPKNVLHQVGIVNSILDINATLKPHFAIVDGIEGMEGDGPIMGTPVFVGALIMGKNLPAVDATCCRIMGINPKKIEYLQKADNWLGPITEDKIKQVGESIAHVQRPFALIDRIPAHQHIRLT